MLDVSDTELSFFKNDINSYSDIDKKIKSIKKQIKPLQEQIKTLTKQKNEKQLEVLEFMKIHDLDVCNTDVASFEMKETKTTKQLTKGDVYDKIYKVFTDNKIIEELNNISGGENKAKFIHDYIYKEDREINVKAVLKTK